MATANSGLNAAKWKLFRNVKDTVKSYMKRRRRYEAKRKTFNHREHSAA
jgi:hypothetical protein